MKRSPQSTVSIETVLKVVERCAEDLRLVRTQERKRLQMLQQAVVMAHELGASYREIAERAQVTKSHVGYLVRGRER